MFDTHLLVLEKINVGNFLIFCLFVMERAGITRGYCHFVGKTWQRVGTTQM